MVNTILYKWLDLVFVVIKFRVIFVDFQQDGINIKIKVSP